MFAFKLTGMATVLGAVLMLWFGWKVGALRGKLQIKAPAMTGDPAFERAVRVQMNTIEQAVLFLPLMWVFAATSGDLYAGVAGFVWCLGRVLYAVTYWEDASKRSAGFGIGFLATLACLLGAIYGVAMA